MDAHIEAIRETLRSEKMSWIPNKAIVVITNEHVPEHLKQIRKEKIIDNPFQQMLFHNMIVKSVFNFEWPFCAIPYTNSLTAPSFPSLPPST